MKKVFILGNPRSGTSLIRLMLQQHSNIVAPPESGFMQWWFNKYKNWKIDDNSDNEVDKFLDDLFTSKKIETWNLSRNNLKNNILQKKPKNYGELMAIIYMAYKFYSENLKVIVDKNNYYINHLEDIKQIWPEAKFIHVVRDGRDIACSYLDVNKLKTRSPYKPKLSTSIERIAYEWIENNRKIFKLSEHYLEKYILIKYEDIVFKPKETLSKICKFLDVVFEPEMLTYYKKKSNKYIEPTETIDWKKKVLEKPDWKKVGRHKKELSKEQIELFNKIASNDLIFYGYQL